MIESTTLAGAGAWQADGAGLPSVGRGQDLPWARSWEQLSGRVAGLDREAMRAFDRPIDLSSPHGIGEHFRALAEMSRRLHLTGAEVQLVMHLVHSVHGVTDKLVRQQG